MTQENTIPDSVFMPDEIWATPVKTWSKFEKPATNKGDMTCNRKCAARYKYIRADIHEAEIKRIYKEEIKCIRAINKGD